MKIGGIWIELPETEIEDTESLVRMCFEAIETAHFQQWARMRSILFAIVFKGIYPARDALVIEMGWDLHQEDFVCRVELRFIKQSVSDLEELVLRRITRTKKKERWARTSIADLKLSTILIYLMELPLRYNQYIEEKMALEYEEP